MFCQSDIYLEANMGQISFLFLTLLVSYSLAESCNNLLVDAGRYTYIVLSIMYILILEWDGGLTGDLYITPDNDASSFTVVLTFDQELTSFQQWTGTASSTDNK